MRITAQMKQSHTILNKVDNVIEILRSINIDGETMQYILERVGMDDQMLRQLIMSNPESDTKDILEEKIELSNQRLASK